MSSVLFSALIVNITHDIVVDVHLSKSIIMDKRDIRIRLVDTRTGEIFFEYNEMLHLNLYFKNNCAMLHVFLDDFIKRLRNLSEEDALYLEFTAITDYVQGKLSF